MTKTTLSLLHGDIPLPAYLPDATLGVVRAVDSFDLEQIGVQAIVMNVYHLMQKPGSSTIQALGGLHKMAHWLHPIITDSGGFQAYSLVRQNAKFGKINDQGIRFKPEGAEREFQLTPEKSVQLQLAYGSDVVICLDDCTHISDSPAEQEASVARTIAWAKRCKAEFQRILEEKEGRKRKSAPRPPILGETEARPPTPNSGGETHASHRLVPQTEGEVEISTNQSPQNWGLGGEKPEESGASPTPLIFGVVQGGGSAELRKRCAEALLEIGFDGFGYGGWPLDSEGNLVHEMLEATRQFIPSQYPLHALGVGHPESVVACTQMGYDLFDSALPTRDARNGRLFTFTTDPNSPEFTLTDKWFRYLYIQDAKHIKTDRILSPGCTCPTCRQYSIGYLHHLYECSDTLFYRLATLHNLHFMMQLMSLLRASASTQVEAVIE